ncbi:MAG: energy-coupling factor ABC transporter ATP-binding protein, partial [Dehalococcoidia bacterium]|nr:energy-coupling factor ABC transporter ATP-binding protein [Dehalococcoidia bacterium]
MIEFRHFTFTYAGHDRPAVEDVSVAIRDGEVVLLVGPSGGGKTTLCRCLNGLIPHFHGGLLRGKVVVDGLDITQHQPREFATRVGMVFQDPENQLVGADVERDIAFGLENLGIPPQRIGERVEQALASLGIAALRRASLATLSGGEKQKAALAAVVAMHPSVLVLDEPTSELDPLSAREFMRSLMRLHDEHGVTIVLVEHRLERVVEYCSRTVVVDRGHIVADGDTRSVLDRLAVSTHGVGVPPMAELARAFRLGGIWNGATPLSVAEAQGQFGRFLPLTLPEPPARRSVPQTVSLLTAADVSFCYSAEAPVLDGVSVSVSPGEMLAVMGRNGSGKTTLVKHFNGLLKPFRGSVRVRAQDTREVSVSELARNVGMVFQNPNDHLFADTVEEEILFTLKHLRFDEDEAHRRAGEVLVRFSLEEYRGQYPRSLIGGERQRVALASVVAARPDVLVLDEPTRGLGHEMKLELMSFLRS